MGLRIEQLCEVIDDDPTLMRPPGAPAYVRGVLNLRQQLITVVDLRTLYGMAATDGTAAGKILVVDRDGEKIGLVVDAIHDIVSIDRADKLRIPGMVAQRLDAELQHDLHEVVDLPDQTTVMLLDAAPLMQRLSGARVH